LRRRAAEFDIIHFHTNTCTSRCRDYADKTLTTLHGRLDLPDLPVIMREFSMMPLVSISDDATDAALLGQLDWQKYCTACRATSSSWQRRRRLSSLSRRIAPEKGPDRAIAIARGPAYRCRLPPRSTRSIATISNTRSRRCCRIR